MILDRKREVRTRKQWTFYFKENFFRKNPRVFLKNSKRKWRFLKQRFFNQVKNGKRFRRRKFRLRRLRPFFKLTLRNKHKFKIYYGLKTEKKFKKFIRLSLNLKREEVAFYAIIQRRLDTLLVSSGMLPNIYIARVFIRNKHIFVNDRIETKAGYIVKNMEVVRVSEFFKKFVYKNLSRKYKKRKCLKKQKNIELNLNTLELSPYGFIKGKKKALKSKIALDLIRRSYRR